METVFVLLMMVTVGLSHDPLVLQPARVVVRYGDSVSVNCSTPSSDHEGMGWEASVGGTDLMENVTYVTWTVDSLTTWTIDPFCYINIGTEQPSKELPVTLYKTPDTVKISQVNGTGPMFEGTEYQLQCKIIRVAPLQNLTVKWYRQNKILPVLPSVFDAADGLPKDAIHTISIIPSRTDHLAQYQCAAQLDLGPDGPQPPPTKTSLPLTVYVFYKPVIQDCPSHSSGVEHKFTLSTLPCLVDGFPAATVHWYHGGREVDAATPLTRMQSGTFILEAQNALGQTNTSIDITIEYPLVLQPARVVVRYGDSVSVNCSTPSSDHDGMGWEASVGGTDLMENVTYVTWTVDSLTTWTIDPFCYINIGTEQPSKELPVTLYKTPDTVKVSQVNGTGPMFEEGTEYQLQCKIIQVAPLQNLTVKWYRQNKPFPVPPSVFDAVDGLPKDAIHTISIIPSRTDHGAQYQCAAQLDLGPDGPQPPPTKTSSPLTVLVFYRPVIQDCPSHSSGVEHEFTLSTLTCLVDGFPPPTVHWYHGGREVDAATPLTRMQSGTFILEAQNDVGQTSMSIDITLESPVSPPKLSSECLSQGQMRVSCSCEGDSVQYSWTLDGQTLTDEHLLCGHHDTQNITLIQGLSGRLSCSVRNTFSSDAVSENISPCGGQSVYFYFKVAEMCVLLMVCVGFYIYYKMKTRPPPPQDPLYCNMVVMETQ